MAMEAATGGLGSIRCQDQFNRELQKQMRRTVWTSGHSEAGIWMRAELTQPLWAGFSFTLLAENPKSQSPAIGFFRLASGCHVDYAAATLIPLPFI